MRTELMCPHCGWHYLAGGEPPLVPKHNYPEGVTQPLCPGSEQHPRNPETDRRRLWKGGGEP